MKQISASYQSCGRVLALARVAERIIHNVLDVSNISYPQNVIIEMKTVFLLQRKLMRPPIAKFISRKRGERFPKAVSEG